MRNKSIVYFAFLLLLVSALSVSGCSKLFGPSDKEVIEAINQGGFFKGGYGELTLQAPITILEKGGRNKDGVWPVKVKVIFTAYLNKEQISAPMEKTVVFNISKAKDSTGHTVWRAAWGS